MSAISSLSALQDAVQALPPVPKAKVRVFRGQTKDYRTIIPAAFRNHLELNAIWRVYTRWLVMDITNEAFNGHGDDKELQILTIWLDALAQHYASGSRYLDVTHSIESAAWFALHCCSPMKERSVLGPPGPPSPYDLPSEVTWLQYSPAVEAGFLYAFDVDQWDGHDAKPSDLAVIDLSQAPEPFMTPRMLSQCGCLIRTRDADQHDLRGRCVEGTPLQIAWPMTGSAFVHRKVEEMFPSPAVDPWYRRFLHIPLTPHVNATSGEVVLKRSLPVTLYRGETASYNASIAATDAFLHPPLLHKALQQRQKRTESAKGWWEPLSVHEATPVVLEAPLLGPFVASADSDFWNHELLFGDISNSVATYSHDMQKVLPAVSLRNVLFQFSPLEEVFWERAQTPSGIKRLVRGLWIARHEQEVVAVLIYQDFPHTQVSAWAPALIRLDAAKRRMICKPAGKHMEWVDLVSLPLLPKAIFIALHLLRAMSTGLKCEAKPDTVLSQKQDSGESIHTYLVKVLADTAKLIRLPDPAGRDDWFILRDCEGEPYTEARKGAGIIELQETKPFAQIAASVFRDSILATFSTEKR
jgi:hypothetical protein